MTQTPIQQAIEFWNERYKEAKGVGAIKTMEFAGHFLQYLDAMLTQEKELICTVWDAATQRHIDELDTRGYPDQAPGLNKQQLIDKYYSK